VESGADAVYLGLKSFSARALAENFSLPEFRGAAAEAKRRGVKVYVAANSLVKEGEIREAMALLCAAAKEGPDAFIVQDLGLASLCRRFLPEIPLHASTLAAAHTPGALALLGELGFERAVLPRETTFRELERLSAESPIDLEIFIHGASCFSFSGLCLLSSFSGGRSALRGACTQPCRRAYLNSGRRDTFFSASDFEAAPFVRDLMRLPLAAFKIEGRMKGPDYVSRAVKAYRLLIDSAAGDFEGALAEAADLLDDAPQRKRSQGFLSGAPAVFAPELFSGAAASGTRLGRLRPAAEEGWSAVVLERPLKLHDRLRAVGARGVEGAAFKLKGMRYPSGAAGGLPAKKGDAGRSGPAGDRDSARKRQAGAEGEAAGKLLAGAEGEAAGTLLAEAEGEAAGERQAGAEGEAAGLQPAAKGLRRLTGEDPAEARAGRAEASGAPSGEAAPLEEAPAGAEVEIFIGGKDGFSGAGTLYRTGSGSEEKAWRAHPAARAIAAAAARAPQRTSALPKAVADALRWRRQQAARPARATAGRLWLWLEDARDLRETAPLSPARVILPLTAANAREIAKRRLKGLARVVWSLPPLVFGAEAARLKALAAALARKGFGEFMCASLSGAALAREAGGGRVKIYADHRLGFLNRFAADALRDLGIEAATASLEIDSETWNSLLAAPFKGKTLCYLAGRPPLFTSRYVPGLKRGPAESPRGERFWPAREGEAFVLLPDRKVFMGGFLKGPELPNLLGYIVDLRREKDPAKAAQEARRAAAEGRRAAGSGFNFKRGLS
jgi:putative protease